MDNQTAGPAAGRMHYRALPRHLIYVRYTVQYNLPQAGS